MAEIGQKCNTRLLDKKATNIGLWQEEADRPGMMHMISLPMVAC